MSEKKRDGTKSLGLGIFVGIVMLGYSIWRIFFTLPLPGKEGWLAFFGGLLLLIAEIFSSYEAMTHYLAQRDVWEPEMPEIPEDWYPDVDVFISTHNEDTELLFKTANACTMLHYPDPSKVHVYLCDDTARPEVEELAKKLGVGYFGLKNNKFAKAGNINNALSKSHSPLIATFDADMIPKSNFLMETIPYFFLPRMKRDEEGNWLVKSPEEIDEKEEVGFIQTPQAFYNPDLFQYNLYAEKRVPNEQDYFFRQVNIGKNSTNSVLYAGSNTVISRKALEEVGGIATGTITEDFETGLRIEARGYRCYAVRKVVAQGLAPITISSLIKQRVRWGRGCIYSLRKVHLLTNKEFSPQLKLSYYSCRIYWESFSRRLIYILSPVFFLLLGIPLVVLNLRQLLFVWLPYYILYSFLLRHVSSEIRDARWSNTIDTIMFPYLLIPIWAEELHINEKKFSVTAKSRDLNEQNEFYLAIPHICLLGISLLSLLFAMRALILHRAFGLIIMTAWIAVNSFSLLMAIFFMKGRINERGSERFRADIPLEILAGEKPLEGRIQDISEGGFAFWSSRALELDTEGEKELRFRIKDRDYTALLSGELISVNREKKEKRWVYRVKLSGEMDWETKRQYMQIVYDRDNPLPQKLSEDTSYFDDVLKIMDNSTREREEQRRRLPRFRVREKCRLEDGTVLMLEDFNYRYLRLSPLKGAGLPKRLVLYKGTGYEVNCQRSGLRNGIYKITNSKALLKNQSFLEKLREWEKKQK